MNMYLAPTLCHLSKNQARMLPSLMKLVREMTLSKSASKRPHDYKCHEKAKRKTIGGCWGKKKINDAVQPDSEEVPGETPQGDTGM